MAVLILSNNMSDNNQEEFWRYTRRCKCCNSLIDYSFSRTGISNEIKYSRFLELIKTITPREIFQGCEYCKAVTLQELVGYQHEEDIKTHKAIEDKLTASEAVFGFAGWLTTRKEKTVMSSEDDSACIARLCGQFIKENELSLPRDGWDDNLIHPSGEYVRMEITRMNTIQK